MDLRKVFSRGALIVFEGCDRTGKTSQCVKLSELLNENGFKVELMSFPDRKTECGNILNTYLSREKELNKESVYLLFALNRWESIEKIEKKLNGGTTIILDRYSFSGVAYGVSNGLDIEWCKCIEKGLIKPDIVFQMNASLRTISNRKEFGFERYENEKFQKKVSSVFEHFKKLSYWNEIDTERAFDLITNELLIRSVDLIGKVSILCLEKLWI